jgi:hypothetical protein
MIISTAKRAKNGANLMFLNDFIFWKVKGFIPQCEVITSF